MSSLGDKSVQNICVLHDVECYMLSVGGFAVLIYSEDGEVLWNVKVTMYLFGAWLVSTRSRKRIGFSTSSTIKLRENALIFLHKPLL